MPWGVEVTGGLTSNVDPPRVLENSCIVGSTENPGVTLEYWWGLIGCICPTRILTSERPSSAG